MKPIKDRPDTFIRHARPVDIPAIRVMQRSSMWGLGGQFCSDDAVVEEGHFFVAENRAGTIFGSGGWTRRQPGYASGLGDDLQSGTRPTVRSVFVGPTAARRGVASSIMARVERDALEHGVRALALTAMLSGGAFYERLGYRSSASERLALDDGGSFSCVSMTKRLRAAGRAAA